MAYDPNRRILEDNRFNRSKFLVGAAALMLFRKPGEALAATWNETSQAETNDTLLDFINTRVDNLASRLLKIPEDPPFIEREPIKVGDRDAARTGISLPGVNDYGAQVYNLLSVIVPVGETRPSTVKILEEAAITDFTHNTNDPPYKIRKQLVYDESTDSYELREWIDGFSAPYRAHRTKPDHSYPLSGATDVTDRDYFDIDNEFNIFFTEVEGWVDLVDPSKNK